MKPRINIDLSHENRLIGDAARDVGGWAVAAKAYREMLRIDPTDGGIWLQCAHMLKELGLFRDARGHYEKALALSPAAPEIHFQLGLLAKVSGDFPEAIRSFQRAAELGYDPRNRVEREIKLATPRRPFSLLSGHAQEAPAIRVFLSSIAGSPIVENSGGTKGDVKSFFGAANYSYLFIMKGFIAALEAMEISYRVIRNPEFIPDIRERSNARLNIHIGFYPPDHVRFLKGAYNVISLAWEFERLKSVEETVSYHAFADVVSVLGRADEIWSISAFGTEALRRSGLSRVETVPTPILGGRPARPRLAPPDWEVLERCATAMSNVRWVPLGIAAIVQGTLTDQAQQRRTGLLNVLFSEAQEQPPTIFISVFNVNDYRKQIRPLIEAFVQYAQTNRNAYLLLKVSIVNQTDRLLSESISAAQMFDPGEMIPPYVCDRIWMTADILSNQEMEHLYDCAGFYVCTSHAEGQNLPMLEAMARGVVPISVNNTAMRDYIFPESAVVIPSSERPFTRRLAQRYGLYGVSTYYCDAPDVLRALEQASAMDEATYATYAAAAERVVSERYGVSVVRDAIARVVDRVPSRSGTTSQATTGDGT